VIGQRAEALESRPEIHPYGCYLMSLVVLAWEHGPSERSIEPRTIIALYDRAVTTNAMDSNCYIKDPQAIVDRISPGALRFVGKRDADADLLENERGIELWRLERKKPKEWWYHFVYGSYDPWVRSITRATGELDSLRVFRVVE
jgi:hypothetical protein